MIKLLVKQIIHSLVLVCIKSVQMLLCNEVFEDQTRVQVAPIPSGRNIASDLYLYHGTSHPEGDWERY